MTESCCKAEEQAHNKDHKTDKSHLTIKGVLRNLWTVITHRDALPTLERAKHEFKVAAGFAGAGVAMASAFSGSFDPAQLGGAIGAVFGGGYVVIDGITALSKAGRDFRMKDKDKDEEVDAKEGPCIEKLDQIDEAPCPQQQVICP